MFVLVVGLDISLLDSIKDYRFSNTMLFNNKEEAINSGVNSVNYFLNIASENRILRKKYKTKRELIDAIYRNAEVRYQIKITEVINEANLNLSSSNYYSILKEKGFVNGERELLSNIDEFYNFETGQLISRYEQYGRFEYIRRELSDYDDVWSMYKIGDIVKLKHPYVHTTIYKCPIKQYDEVQIIWTPYVGGYMKGEDIRWHNMYEVRTLDGSINEIYIHYDDISCKIAESYPTEEIIKSVKDFGRHQLPEPW